MPTPRRKAPVEVTPDLSRHQAAAALNVCLATVDELIRTGRLKSYKVGLGRTAARRITPEAINELRRGAK